MHGEQQLHVQALRGQAGGRQRQQALQRRRVGGRRAAPTSRQVSSRQLSLKPVLAPRLSPLGAKRLRVGARGALFRDQRHLAVAAAAALLLLALLL